MPSIAFILVDEHTAKKGGRSMWLMGVMIMLSGSTAMGEAGPCGNRIGELVPNATVAREIAEAIIRNRQTPERMSEYELYADIDEQDASKWVVGQGIPTGPPDAEGAIKVTFGGGGMWMRIDRCDGRVSDVQFALR